MGEQIRTRIQTAGKDGIRDMATIKKSYTTRKPVGITIKRNGSGFQITWKIGDRNYGAGQTFQYRINPKARWSTVAVGYTSTKTQIVVNSSNYYPTTKNKLDKIYVRIRGKRHAWTEDVNGKTIQYNTLYSPWATGEFDARVPNTPVLTATLDSERANVCNFAWTTKVESSLREWYVNSIMQTRLLKNSPVTNGAKLPAKGWSTVGVVGSSGSQEFREDSSVVNVKDSYTRWVRIQARGPQGDSAWRYAKHVYGIPYKAKEVRASAKANSSNGYTCTVRWTTVQTACHPIDSIVVEYVFATPTSGLNCPDGVTWSEATTLAYKDGSDAASFTVDRRVHADECMYVRVNTVHDNNVTPGSAVRVAVGALSDPSGVTATADISDHTVAVQATNNSGMGSSFLRIIFYSNKYPQGINVGIIPHGQNSKTVTCPVWENNSNIKIGVQAVVGSYTYTTRPSGVSVYNITRDAESKIVKDMTYGGSVPVAPTEVTLSKTANPGVVRVTWDCPWTAATGAELSWADHNDAWHSTDGPSRYDGIARNASGFNIGNLDQTKTWYVRVRLYQTSNGETKYSAYSQIQSIDLSEEPAVPELVLSKDLISTRGNVVASWTYTPTDGSKQASAELAEVTTVNGVERYTKIASTKTARKIRINAARQNWSVGETHEIVLRITTSTGKRSEWSNPAALHIADPLVINLSATSLESQTITVGDVSRTIMALTQLPLTATITGAGVGGTTRLIIERAEDYHLVRPDESDINGFEGETVVSYSQLGEAQISIDTDDLVGYLDDGAAYRLIAAISDDFGQHDEVVQEFEVHWTHQALVPEATVLMDQTNLIAKLTPIAPTGALPTDVCDIYRLSVDKPELIYPGATFGTTYVDPYPTIGEYGGHRFVFRTANGDYITEDDRMAWIDTREADGDLLEYDYHVIDFGTGRVMLELNTDLSSTWAKDFAETKYLGGSVQGDWNPAVSRTGTLSAVTVVSDDDGMIEEMRRLAVYPGICHVRTKDGSSYPADVQVAESYSQDDGHKIVSFDLTITRVDAEEYEGMTLTEWEGDNG